MTPFVKSEGKDRFNFVDYKPSFINFDGTLPVL